MTMGHAPLMVGGASCLPVKAHLNGGQVRLSADRSMGYHISRADRSHCPPADRYHIQDQANSRLVVDRPCAHIAIRIIRARTAKCITRRRNRGGSGGVGWSGEARASIYARRRAVRPNFALILPSPLFSSLLFSPRPSRGNEPQTKHPHPHLQTRPEPSSHLEVKSIKILVSTVPQASELSTVLHGQQLDQSDPIHASSLRTCKYTEA